MLHLCLLAAADVKPLCRHKLRFDKSIHRLPNIKTVDSHWLEYKDTTRAATTVRLHVYKNFADKFDLHRVAQKFL